MVHVRLTHGNGDTYHQRRKTSTRGKYIDNMTKSDITIRNVEDCSCMCRLGGRLCGLLVRVPDYISRGPGSIPDATRFSEK
jgi:hypothetical protein